MASQRKAGMSAHFFASMLGFLRERPTLDQARKVIQEDLKGRDTNFLRMIEKKIFSNPKSPYVPLLQSCGWNFQKIQELVLSQGIEATLRKLRQSGAYISFEEFKGRKPIVRDTFTMAPAPSDFDNPDLCNTFTTRTSGSTGRGVSVSMSLDHIARQSLYDLLSFEALQVRDAPLMVWFSAFPGFLGPYFLLRSARAGIDNISIFDPRTASPKKTGWRQLLLKKGFYGLLHLYGFQYQEPTVVPLHQPDVIAKHIYKTLRTEGKCIFRSYMNMCLRVCCAATRNNLDLTGAVFFGGGEPVTPAKVHAILNTGARFIPTYHSTEAGFMGIGCLTPSSSNDIHIFLDSMAIISAPRHLPEYDVSVEAAYTTLLLPESPKVMLNVESDDYGSLEYRDCGCPFHDLGYSLHFKDIFSFCKLTGLGVTLVGNDALKILEEELPRRFGGSLLDYQLVEEELQDGQTVINLYVSPRVRLEDTADVRSFFLETLAGGRFGNPFAASQWGKSGAFRVLHSEPVRGKGGKLMPLHLQSRPEVDR